MDSRAKELIEAAQREIAAVLARLEKQIGATVEDFGIVELDLEYSAAGEATTRAVHISMHRVPGSEWCT